MSNPYNNNNLKTMITCITCDIIIITGNYITEKTKTIFTNVILS